MLTCDNELGGAAGLTCDSKTIDKAYGGLRMLECNLELVHNVAELGHHLALQGNASHGLAAGVSLSEAGENGTGPVSKGGF